MKASLRGPCCNGTRIAGDKWTHCEILGPVTLCVVCHKVIAVEWLISAEERSEQAANGVSYKALVEGNNVLTKELRELTDA